MYLVFRAIRFGIFCAPNFVVQSLFSVRGAHNDGRGTRHCAVCISNRRGFTTAASALRIKYRILFLLFGLQTSEQLDAVREVDLSKLEASAMEGTGVDDEEGSEGKDDGSGSER